MKLLPKQTRVNTQDSLGHGMDAVILMALFVLAGFGLDTLFGTLPVFMVILAVLGAIGIFVTFKYRYEARMDQLQDERTAAAASRQQPGQQPRQPGSAA